jgi:hypothetical protein
VGSLLVAQAKSRLDSAAPYFFCKQPHCPVVYFNDHGVFTKEEVSVPVFQKEPGDPSIPVCYCFGFTPAKIRAEVEATGKSTVVGEITRRVKAGECDCERKNPQGSCCLGNVNAAVRRAVGAAGPRGHSGDRG